MGTVGRLPPFLPLRVAWALRHVPTPRADRIDRIGYRVLHLRSLNDPSVSLAVGVMIWGVPFSMLGLALGSIYQESWQTLQIWGVQRLPRSQVGFREVMLFEHSTPLHAGAEHVRLRLETE